MREHLVWVLALGARGVEASIAIGANTHTIKAKVTPAKQKNKHGPASLNVTTASCVEPCGGAGAVKPATRRIFIDDDIKLDTRGLATCRAQQIEGTTTAAAKARRGRALVGSGRTVALIGGNPDSPVVGVGTFNGAPKGGRPTLLVHSRTEALGFATVLSGTYKPASGDYGLVLDTSVPPLPLDTALVEFQNKLQKTYNARGEEAQLLLRQVRRPERTWNFKGIDTYTGNPTLTATVTQKCTARR